jgi:hypothetical protein
MLRRLCHSQGVFRQGIHPGGIATKATHGTSILMACDTRVAWFAPFVEGICRGRPAKTGKNAGTVSELVSQRRKLGADPVSALRKTGEIAGRPQ